MLPPTGPEKSREARHAFRQARGFGSEAPADESFAFGTERASRREAQFCLVHESLAKCQAIGEAVQTEKGIHRPCWRGDFDARQFDERAYEVIAGGAKARQRSRDRRF